MSDGSEPTLIYMTAGSAEEARRIGKALVEARLAACVNLIEGMKSMYWWEGAVQEDAEVVMIAKTRAALVEPLTAKVRGLHSYDCPCVVAVPIAGGNPAFLEWIAKETRGTQSEGDAEGDAD
jgi:periplasmic divalent cation tolerance protein